MQHTFQILVVFIFLLAGGNEAFTQTLSVTNKKPRLDTEGKIVDAHDGRTIQFGKRFYWYGTRYGQTNGFTQQNEYVCYSSENLKDWKYEGVLLPEKPNGVYYRPHVVFNKLTGKYILWYNWYPKLWKGRFGVAESASPTGPFKIVNDDVRVKNSPLGVGDLSVFADDDGTGYLSYNTLDGHQVSVEKLDENYTASTFQSSGIITSKCEAGSIFKRDGRYYLLTDITCCFCTQGSGARVYIAENPLGPYVFRQNINRYPGSVANVLLDGKTNNNFYETLLPEQNNGIEAWFASPAVVSGITINQFTGNRSGQCGQVENPNVHDPILTYEFEMGYFSNGEWKKFEAGKPVIKKTALDFQYTFSFHALNAERVRIMPQFNNLNYPLFLSEVSFKSSHKTYTVYKTALEEGRPIVPAQQSFVMEIQTKKGKEFVWIGDLWGSSSENIKGHDFQYWSAPLQFYPNGLIRPLAWTDNWKVSLH